jgi:RNA polymerase sigma factor (sigma-70 family)
MTAAGKPDDSLERMFLEQLPVIDRILGIIARRNSLAADDAEEFAAWARAHIVENGYALLAKFEGRSSLPTYLTVALVRLYRDYRNSLWGRWRPSAIAQRMGVIGIRLEELISRAGCPLREAIAMLRAAGVQMTEGELARMAAALPRRTSHREVPLEDVADSLPDSTGRAAPENEERERVLNLLRAAIEALPSEDRVITRMRFWDGSSVADIARLLRLEHKPLYRRVEAIQRRLRAELERCGVSAEAARDLLSEVSPE